MLDGGYGDGYDHGYIMTVTVVLVVIMRYHGCVNVFTIKRGSCHVVYSLHRGQQGFCLVKVPWPCQL